MTRLLAFLMIFVAGTCVASPKRAIPYGTDGAPGNWSRLGCGGTVCRITYNPGGNIDWFYQQMDIARRDRVKIVLDGHCISACTIFVDHMRPNVCITQNAVLEFHNGTTFLRQPNGRFEPAHRIDIAPAYSDDIVKWVNENGGFPGKDVSPREMAAFLVMPFSEARKFFKVC